MWFWSKLPGMAVLLLLASLLTALAAETNASACMDCCRAAGLPGCTSEIYVQGEASKVYREGSGWRVEGMHIVSCDGRGFFDDGRTATFESQPLAGSAALQSAEQWACFAASCQLPLGMCFDGSTGRATMCQTGAAPTPAAFRAAPAPRGTTTVAAAAPVSGGMTVIVGGRSLTVELAPAEVAPVGTPAPVAAPVAPPKPKPSGVLFDDMSDEDILAEMRGEPPKTAPAAPVFVPEATPTYTPSPTPPPVGPTALYSPAPTTLPKPDAIAQLTEGLPKDPPDDCEPPGDALRGEARKQVMTGDDLRMAKDAAGAVQKYRAALSMDSCSGYAWLGLGESAVALDRPDIAIRALRNATTLLPKHYGAWTALGLAYEATRQVSLAVAAFRMAIELKPGLEAASAGLTRLGAY